MQPIHPKIGCRAPGPAGTIWNSALGIGRNDTAYGRWPETCCHRVSRYGEGSNKPLLRSAFGRRMLSRPIRTC